MVRLPYEILAAVLPRSPRVWTIVDRIPVHHVHLKHLMIRNVNMPTYTNRFERLAAMESFVVA